MNSYVRDFYFFRRNFYPQLSLVHMDPDEAQENLQKQAFLLKFGEIGKVLFTVSILETTCSQQVSYVSIALIWSQNDMLWKLGSSGVYFCNLLICIAVIVSVQIKFISWPRYM